MPTVAGSPAYQGVKGIFHTHTQTPAHVHKHTETLILQSINEEIIFINI